MNTRLPSEKVQKNLMTIVEYFNDEDRAVRERQIRKARRLKLYWDNIFQAWYSEVAHDWRIYDNQQASDEDTNQSYYDKPINTFRAYIESVIAALSITTPAAKCFPEDADSSLDIVTARAGDKIGQLIARHNNTQLLWLHALYIYYTEGTVFGYNYADAKDEYGIIEEDVTKEEVELRDVLICPACNQPTEVDAPTDVFQPEEQPQDNCSFCGNLVTMVPDKQSFTTTKIVGKNKSPKSRVNLRCYGGLYVKIDNSAKEPSQTPYLIFSEETHYANAVEKYEHLHDSKLVEKIRNDGGSTGPYDEYSRQGRLNTVYQGEYPNYVVTMRSAWLRPAAYNVLGELADIKELRKLYPRGVKVCMVNDEFGEAKHEALDDYWTITNNPMEDYLVHDAAGTNLVPTQEITNDIISLVLQTVEHGIGQTFADPGVLNFPAYRDTEVTPGGVYEATPKSGKSLGDGFFEMKTATLSHEVMPFFEVIQGLAQLVSGALPSLFGGQLDGSNTASEYSMSRAQALQRIQNTWKLFTAWWKEVQGKAIPLYINNMKEDEKDVQRNDDGSFVNVFIRRAELEGRIGKIELEASENLPQTWLQVKDTITKLMEVQNPQIAAMLASPENLPLLRDALGLVDFYIPGEDDRNKQYDEIKECLASEPIPGGMGPEGEIEESSVPIDPIFDNHQIEFEIVRGWAVSEAGRLAKIENPLGYKNALLHGVAHYDQMQQQMMQQATEAGMAEEAANSSKPAGSSEIKGESDVPVGV